MTPNVDDLYATTYHKAVLINGRGGVSALCFKRPRAIDLKKALWTIVDDSVTCPKCLRLMRVRAR